MCFQFKRRGCIGLSGVVGEGVPKGRCGNLEGPVTPGLKLGPGGSECGYVCTLEATGRSVVKEGPGYL